MLYDWNHLRVDMIVSDYLPSPIIVRGEDFGIQEQVDIVKTDEASSVVSRHFIPQIVEPKDIEKIRMPELDARRRGHGAGV